MKLWLAKGADSFYDNQNVRTGLRLKFDSGVDPEVRGAIIRFSKWLRANFSFPIRVVVYVKAAERVKAKDGDMVCGTSFTPFDRLEEPYIRESTGDYPELSASKGRDNALAAYLYDIAHELTHYYQWVKDGAPRDSHDERQVERQANYYATLIVHKYAETTEHP